VTQAFFLIKNCQQVLVVHGIGQAMKRVELGECVSVRLRLGAGEWKEGTKNVLTIPKQNTGVTQLKSIVECCDTMRSNTEEIDLQQQQGQLVWVKDGCGWWLVMG
jgi:hypothetical protein